MHTHLVSPPQLIFFDLNIIEKYFVRFSFCTSPPVYPLIQGFTLFSLSCAIPVLNSDYYLQFKDLIRMTDVSHCSLNTP